MLNSQKGVGLVEILIALVIFAVGISFAMRLLPSSNVATTRGRNLTKAANLAQEKIEELMDVSYGSASLTNGAHTDADNPIDHHFTRSWAVSDDTPVKGMKEVSVTVSYSTASPDSSVTLTTLITSRR